LGITFLSHKLSVLRRFSVINIALCYFLAQPKSSRYFVQASRLKEIRLGVKPWAMANGKLLTLVDFCVFLGVLPFG